MKTHKLLFIAGGALITIGLIVFLIYKNIMKISTQGKELLKKLEGLQLTSYKDVANVLTIGYGHTGSDVTVGKTISQTEAENLLVNDLKKFESGVLSLTSRVSLNQNQYDALVIFAYNVGLGALGGSTLLKKVIANPKDSSIRGEFLKWVNAGGQKVQGLVNRRTEEANLYFS